ncbi:hypothetical protein PACID_09110 [Acidipropionibacterium acidipropionici ATCC 4875]|uniref:Uncharacterized protein n=1 Tax=Acidipropionibacterium acidipropionici (strain ATCC 4875 / DSM 20272 / JCM 6432 / NBRC 12425 / NCIMB 8070 / 4) TaxID=1171373 RepID=K7RUW1_ACIA4|nr:hypothetical protein PACID_09110 [Acidipropionibacterium acidipropionici ATCC 4875]
MSGGVTSGTVSPGLHRARFRRSRLVSRHGFFRRTRWFPVAFPVFWSVVRCSSRSFHRTFPSSHPCA